jgi:hypothetical protein
MSEDKFSKPQYIHQHIKDEIKNSSNPEINFKE